MPRMESSRTRNLVPGSARRTTNHPASVSWSGEATGGSTRERNLTYQLASRSEGPYPPRAFDRAPLSVFFFFALPYILLDFFSFRFFFILFIYFIFIFNFVFFHLRNVLSRRCENRDTNRVWYIRFYNVFIGPGVR